MASGYRWVRLDADYFTHPKVLAAGRDARDLHLASLCWVSRQLTDGHIPPEAISSIALEAGLTRRQQAPAIERAETAGLWLPNGYGFDLHGYLERNPSRDKVEQEREQWKVRKQRHRARGDTGDA